VVFYQRQLTPERTRMVKTVPDTFKVEKYEVRQKHTCMMLTSYLAEKLSWNTH